MVYLYAMWLVKKFKFSRGSYEHIRNVSATDARVQATRPVCFDTCVEHYKYELINGPEQLTLYAYNPNLFD